MQDRAPEPEVVRAEVKKILDTKRFQRSPRSRAFLIYVTNATLEGDTQSVKESLIALKVFEIKDFDSSRDAIVRRGASRLREMLGEYYATEGQNDPVIIEIPEGSYIPQFTPQSISTTEACDPRIILKEEQRRRFRPVLFLLVVLCSVLVVGGAFVWARWDARNTPVGPAPDRPSRVSAVAVLGFENLSRTPETSWLSTFLSETFRTELAIDGQMRRIPGEDVARMKAELALAYADSLSQDTLSRIRKHLSCDFVLLGSYAIVGEERGRHIRLNLTLQDTKTGEMVTVAENGTEAEIFQLIARTGMRFRRHFGLRQLSPNELRRLETLFPRNVEARRLYLQALEKLWVSDAAGAKDLLQVCVRAEPLFALAHSALSDAWAVLGYEVAAKEEAAIAFDLSAKAPHQEARFIEAKYREQTQDFDRAITLYRTLSSEVRDSPEYALRLAKVQAASGKAQDAVKTLEDLRRLPSPFHDDPQIDLTHATIAESIGNFKEEQKAATSAIKKAQARGAELLAARAQLRLSWALNKLGKPEPAKQMAEAARGVFHSAGDKSGEAQALKNLADVIGDQGGHAEAQKLYATALDIFRQIGHEAAVAVTLNNMAYEIKDQGDLPSAKTTFEKSLATSQKIKHKRFEAMALNGLAGILWRQGDLTGARIRYQEALRIQQTLRNTSQIATLLGNIALVLHEQGYLQHARERLEQSLTMLRNMGEKAAIARTLGNIGALLFDQGKLAEAFDFFEEQLTLGRAIQNDKQIAYALFGRGTVFLAQGDLKQARTSHERALLLRVKTNEAELVTESRLEMADLALHERNAVGAAFDAMQAAEDFQRRKEFDQAAMASTILTRALLLQGKREEAHPALQRALDLGKKTQNAEVGLELAITAAKMKISVGQLRQAIKGLRSALATARKHGYVGLELESRLTIAEAEIKLSSSAPPADLTAIEDQARRLGFVLIAGRAASMRMSDRQCCTLTRGLR